MQGNKLFVGGLPFSVTDDELSALFAEYGTVTSATVIKDKFTDRSKGFGFVEMSSDAEAQAAINGLHDREVGGRKITVNVARPKEDRPRRDFGGNGGGSDFRQRSW